MLKYRKKYILMSITEMNPLLFTSIILDFNKPKAWIYTFYLV